MRQKIMSKKEQLKISILLSVAVIVSLVFVIYGQIKANEVKELNMQIQEMQYEMQRMSEEAVQFQERAMEAAADAVKQRKEAELALSKLQECQSK